ncbi:proprotein convertase P-domain-containing protein [Bacillus spongiae]|uniref:Proprotein convertase P-domain-containing protein n=1 Tax=Bacillus spongiae TaxID=2683610 RepID=A0ABU8H8H6_9BACI
MKALKRLLPFFLLVFIVSPVEREASANVTTIVPNPVGVSDTPGTWFTGAIPDNVDHNQPPIVFVQGLHGNARDWWENTVYYGDNDMYQHAYLNGFRTAFVQLEDATGGDAADVWHNGKMLAEMLEEIYHFFGEKVNIVAHSKGGVDTQAALVQYEAWPYVNDVITLSSPHYGSPLADLAYSWYAGWLADLIKRTDDGTYSMQTGEMEKFRFLIDRNESVFKNDYFTASGTGWGPIFSALWFGGLYLGGDNDGLVPVWSTKLPYSTHFFSGGDDIDHDNIRTGSSSFKQINSVLRNDSINVIPTLSPQPSNEQYVPEQLLRGNKIPSNTAVTELIPVESGNNQITFQVMTSGEDVNVVLTSPKGKQYTKRSKQHNDYIDKNYFNNAYTQTFTINNPEAGEWQMVMNSNHEDAYFIVTNFQGSNALNMKWSQIEKKAKDKKQKGSSKIKLETKVKKTKPRLKNGAGVGSGSLNIIESETNNVTYEIIGTKENGEKFYRTVVKSYFQTGTVE